MTTRETCGACGHDVLELILDLGLSPVADAYTTSADELSATYPLQLVVCRACGLVQLLEVLDQATLFGNGYAFYSSASPPLSAYHAGYADDLLRRHGELAKRLTVEIGCNDGDLLRHLDAAGCVTLGVDPAAGPARVAHERGLEVAVRGFDLVLADEIREQYGKAGVVIANHVLAHVADVSDVMAGMQHLLADDGVVYLEVQYLPDLITNNAFDLVYHEHRNFFSLTSLSAAAARWGLYVVHAALTDRQGGSLRVVLARNSSWTDRTRERILASEAWLKPAAYGGLQGRAERLRYRLRDLLLNELQLSGRVLGYGAPAKATTLLNFCELDATWIEKIVDTTPDKQHRYVPGTGIEIVAPREVELDAYSLVMVNAWNYASAIMRQHRGYAGRWLLPVPAPVLL